MRRKKKRVETRGGKGERETDGGRERRKEGKK